MTKPIELFADLMADDIATGERDCEAGTCDDESRVCKFVLNLFYVLGG